MHREMEEWLHGQAEPHEDRQTISEDVCDQYLLSVKSPSNSVTNLVQAVHTQEACSAETSILTDETLAEFQSDDVLPKKTPSVNWGSLDPLKRRLVYDICPKVLVPDYFFFASMKLFSV